MICTVCESLASSFATAQVLGKYAVAYYRCSNCGFIQTEEPYWLKEAYSAAITGSDVGLVRRNLQLATISKVLISAFFDRAGSFVDYAGGYGLFVRLMRDNGFDFSWYDKYCENLFARDFAAPLPGSESVELLTAFEVFEHLADPWGELQRMLAFSRNILFSTQLQPNPVPRPGEWWYYGVEHGQHIAIYTKQALAALAKRAGLNFYTNGASMHLFTEKRLSQPLFFALARFKVARVVAPLVASGSLLAQDFHKGTGLRLG